MHRNYVDIQAMARHKATEPKTHIRITVESRSKNEAHREEEGDV